MTIPEIIDALNSFKEVFGGERRKVLDNIIVAINDITTAPIQRRIEVPPKEVLAVSKEEVTGVPEVEVKRKGPYKHKGKKK